MRLLHASDFLLGNRNYRRDITNANGHDLMDLDRRAALDRAVGCALEHDVDVLLIAGGLLDDKYGELAPYEPWLRERVAQCTAADVAVVVLDDSGGEQTAALDGIRRLTADEPHLDVAGVRFARLAEAPAASAATDMPVIAVGRGKVRRGMDAAHEEIDRDAVMEAARTCAYVALGGNLECCALAPNAYYSGAPCGLFGWHPGDPGALIVQVGRATRQVLDLIHVRWTARRRVSVSIDAGGMDAALLATVLHDRLDEACMSVDEHAPLEPDHPLAQLYGAPSGANGVGWWSRPIVEVTVRHASVLPGEVFRANQMLAQLLNHGEHLSLRLKWQTESGDRPTTSPFVPHRG